MSSRLFQEIRENRGLVYSIYAFPNSYTDGGLFGIYAGTGETETGELIPVLCEEIMKTGNDIGEDELKRAQAQLKAGILMSLESTASRAEQLGRQMLVFDRPIPIEEVIQYIDSVDVGRRPAYRAPDHREPAHRRRDGPDRQGRSLRFDCQPVGIGYFPLA